jgi:hypothetical protein
MRLKKRNDFSHLLCLILRPPTWARHLVCYLIGYSGVFMKKVLLVILIAVASTANAWLTPDNDSAKVYSFKFKMNDELYEYTQKAKSYEDAYGKAAQACFTHFKAGRRVSEDQGLDIIDVCANPRKI